jgi:hypothetical protein
VNQQPGDVTWVPFNQSTAAAHAVVAGVTGKRVLFCGCVLVAASANAITVEASGGTNLCGPVPAGANGVFVAPENFNGYGGTPSGEGLSVLLGSAVQTGGMIGYRFVNG